MKLCSWKSGGAVLWARLPLSLLYRLVDAVTLQILTPGLRRPSQSPVSSMKLSVVWTPLVPKLFPLLSDYLFVFVSGHTGTSWYLNDVFLTFPFLKSLYSSSWRSIIPTLWISFHYLLTHKTDNSFYARLALSIQLVAVKVYNEIKFSKVMCFA